MRLVVIIVAALTIVGVAALGLVLAQKGATPTATAASTVVASVTQEVLSPPVRQSVKLPKRRVPKRRPSFCRPTSTRNPAAQ